VPVSMILLRKQPGEAAVEEADGIMYLPGLDVRKFRGMDMCV
jgi:hypothetical protein